MQRIPHSRITIDQKRPSSVGIVNVQDIMKLASDSLSRSENSLNTHKKTPNIESSLKY